MTIDTPTNDTAGQGGSPGDPGDTPDVDAPDTPDADDDTDDPDDDHDEGTGGRRNREAQYRRRAQTAEAERDQLRDRLQAVQQQQVDEIARAAGVDPRLLAAAGHELATLVADDGTVNRDAVTAACDAARDAFLPTPGRIGTGRRPSVNGQQGAHGDAVHRIGVGAAIAKALGR